MITEQRRRAGRAVASRIAEMHATLTEIARVAEVSPKTVRALIRGTHWPTDHVQASLERALRWRPGEIHARSCEDGNLDRFSDLQLATELVQRMEARHQQDAQLRATDRERKRDSRLRSI